MTEGLNTNVPALLQELYQKLGGRLASIETFLVALGQQTGHNAELLGHFARIPPETPDRLALSIGRMQCRQLPKGTPIHTLADVEFKVWSQWGEDGIIEWLVAHLPQIPRTFVEFGVEDFHEANCRFLIENRSWKGLILDGNEDYMTGLRDKPLYWQRNLTAVPAFVTAETIDELLTTHGFTGEIGILSIDIDGNDYWVWERITAVNPAIVIVEMNGVLGDVHPVTIPYNPYFERLKGHESGQYFGAGIAALKYLADKRGYEFLGTNSDGINAFFLRRDLAPCILPLLRERRAWPSLHRDSRDATGNLTFTAGPARLDLIGHLPVVDVTSGKTILLKDLERPYSEAWLAGMDYRPDPGTPRD